jgi:hypothetical protein
MHVRFLYMYIIVMFFYIIFKIIKPVSIYDLVQDLNHKLNELI